MKKPQRVITIVHTGNGNSGYTKINNLLTNKTDPLIKYLGGLDKCGSYTHCLLATDRKNVQDFLFILGALANKTKNPKYTEEAERLYEHFKVQLESISGALEPLTGFIRTNDINKDLMYLRCLIRETEIIAVEAVQLGKLNREHIKYLNLLSDLIFTFAWVVSASHGQLQVWEGIV